MTLSEAMKKVEKYLEPIRKNAFPFIPADHVRIIDEDEFKVIEFGFYNFYPIEKETRTIAGLKKIIKWNMTAWYTVHGSFNPFNGGYPDELDEKDLGQFDSIFDCLAEIGKIEISDKINGVCEAIDQEEFAKAEEEWEKEMEKNPPPPQKCPHGNDYSECNACLIASDFAYDAAREDRFR